MISKDFQWFPMISKDSQWFLRISNDFQWFPIFQMVSNCFQWFPMISNSFQWSPMISMVFQWFLWFPMISKHFQWFSMIYNYFQCFPMIFKDLTESISLLCNFIVKSMFVKSLDKFLSWSGNWISKTWQHLLWFSITNSVVKSILVSESWTIRFRDQEIGFRTPVNIYWVFQYKFHCETKLFWQNHGQLPFWIRKLDFEHLVTSNGFWISNMCNHLQCLLRPAWVGECRRHSM